MLKQAKKDIMNILETEWADYKDIWMPMIQEEGKTPQDALDFLNYFA